VLDPRTGKRYRTDIVQSPRQFLLGSLALSSSLLFAHNASAQWDAVSDKASGAIEIRDSGKRVAGFTPKTAADKRGSAKVRSLKVSEHPVVEVRISISDEGPRREEVWVAELPKQDVIWWGEAGSRDVDGETALQVLVSENGIEEYQSAARISRCDATPVHLYRRLWDFRTHQFKPAPPVLPAAAPVTIKAKRGDAGVPAGKPFGGFHFHVASSSAGAKGDVRQLSAPIAVNDGDAATVWTADAGEARGVFFTARSSAGFPITGLRILPGDPRSAKSFAAGIRPKHLTLVWGKAPEQSAAVELVDGPEAAKHKNEPFWIPLPRLVASGCLTVMVNETTPGRGPLSIAELAVMTEVDGPQAADRLVTDLAAGTSCETRRPLLKSVGPAALDKVVEALAKATPGPGRLCLLEALAGLLPAATPATGPLSPALAPALVAALTETSADEERLLFPLFARLPEPPLADLGKILNDEKPPEPDRLRAAQILATLPQPEARIALLKEVGLGSAKHRAGMRAVVAGSRPPLAKLTAEELAKIPASDGFRRADLMFVLAGAASREPEQVDASLGIMRASLKGAAGFEEQGRALTGLGSLRTPAAISELVGFRANSKDSVLRFLATRELALINTPESNTALRAALQDSDPRSREAAALALGQHQQKDAAAEIIAGAKQEPWPLVRRAEVVALGELCTPDGSNLLIRAYEKDIEDIRMAALSGLAHCRDYRASALLVRVLGRLPESADLRTLAAQLLAELKDRRTAAPMAEALKRLRQESQSDVSLESTASETVMALAALGGKDAVAAAVDLLSDSRPVLQKAAAQALGSLCDAGEGAAALKKASQSKDESIAAAASMALSRCHRPH
jgi:HEAT repeat protein